MRVRTAARRGALTLEAAFVYPVMIFLLLLLIAGGVAVFRYQQVTWMAREAARYAAVRGGEFQRVTDSASPTEQEIADRAVVPLLSGMSSQRLTVRVEWVDRGTGLVQPWDNSPKDVRSLNALGEYVTNAVRVTVTYRWSGGLGIVGPLDLRGTAEIPMAF